jgi:crotonobetainyl-CoA:carnitine CoA-transferase CaiB-like acyl-CoA transferase
MQEGIRIGEMAEGSAGGFAGMFLANFTPSIPIGETLRSRVAFGSLLSISGGVLVGWLLSKVRKPLGTGFAIGTIATGFMGLLAILVAPAAALDAPVQPKTFGLSGAFGSHLRKTGRRLRERVTS